MESSTVCQFCNGTGTITSSQDKADGSRATWSYVCSLCNGTGKRHVIKKCEHGNNAHFCDICQKAKDAEWSEKATNARQERVNRILRGTGVSLTVKCEKVSRATCALYRGGAPLDQPRSPATFDKQLALLAGVMHDVRMVAMADSVGRRNRK